MAMLDVETEAGVESMAKDDERRAAIAGRFVLVAPCGIMKQSLRRHKKEATSLVIVH
jgi:hypothetical protein